MRYTDFDEYRGFCDFISNGIGVRVVGSNALRMTGEYIEKKMRDFSLETKRQYFVYENAEGEIIELFNVLGEMKAEDEKRVMVFCAHYDTVPTSRGGIDNTTGVAVVLELAAALSRLLRENSLKSRDLCNILKTTTLRFIALAGEEVGCVGSKAYLESLSQEEKDKIHCAYNFDMFMSKTEDDACLVLNTQGGRTPDGYKTGTDEAPFDNVVSKAVSLAVEEYKSLTGISVETWSPRNYGHSDHQTFHEHFIDSANVTIRGSKRVNGKLPKGYHTSADRYDESMFNMELCYNCLEAVFLSLFNF